MQFVTDSLEAKLIRLGSCSQSGLQGNFRGGGRGGGDGGGSGFHTFAKNLITNWFIEIDHRIRAGLIHLKPDSMGYGKHTK